MDKARSEGPAFPSLRKVLPQTMAVLLLRWSGGAFGGRGSVSQVSTTRKALASDNAYFAVISVPSTPCRRALSDR